MRKQALASARGMLLTATAGVFLALASTPSHAQDDPPPQAGRLSLLSGTVSFQAAGSDDWAQAYANYPVGPGDRIFTDRDGRAEIQVGQTYVRLGPSSDVTLVNDTETGISFGIAQGSAHIHSVGLWQGQAFNISTPNGSASFNQGGELRVDVFPDDDSSVFTDLAYDVYVSGADGYGQNLANGQALELSGSSPVYPQWLQANGPDDLDAWSQRRDQQLANANSYRYVSPEIPGAAELDASGDWMPASDYGPIWFPRDVPPGWAPYHNGHWVNHDPWGWVWVEDEPWGYAPFHYGRWVSYSGRWGWVPGPPAAHPVWSPALVVFAGGIHVGGVGVTAWFPLGPGEAYRPWYHASPRYIDRVNISNMSESRHVHVQNTYVNIVNVTNVTNVTNITYVNRTTAVTAMRNDDFAASRHARQHAVAVDAHQLQNVQVMARPEPRPMPRAIIAAPPARPVPVKTARPVLINQQGQAVAAKPGAVPVAVPVRATPPVVRPLPGRVVVAPPPGAKPAPAAGPRGNPGMPVAMPPARPGAPTPTQQRPSSLNPAGARPGAPNATPPAVAPGNRPAPLPPANPTPASPATRPGAAPPPSGRPTPPPSLPPTARPNPTTPLRPDVNPNPPPAAKPVPPATVPPPSARPTPPTLPPTTRPNPVPPPRQDVAPNPPPPSRNSPVAPPRQEVNPSPVRPSAPTAAAPAARPTAPPPPVREQPPVRQQPTPPPAQRVAPPTAARPAAPAAKPAPQPTSKPPAKDNKSDKDKKTQ